MGKIDLSEITKTTNGSLIGDVRPMSAFRLPDLKVLVAEISTEFVRGGWTASLRGHKWRGKRNDCTREKHIRRAMGDNNSKPSSR
jgi:hypothetical protein